MRKLFVLVASILLFAFSCKRPETAQPQKNNEFEFITSLRISFKKEGEANYTKTFFFRDLDGEGGNDPLIEMDELEANTFYFGKVEVLDESGTNVVDVTPEIKNEKNEHQFFYRVFPENFATVEYQNTDVDDFGVPFGIEPKLTTKNAGTFNLEVDLRHQANNTKPRTGQGNPTLGGSDILVVFSNIVVK